MAKNKKAAKARPNLSFEQLVTVSVQRAINGDIERECRRVEQQMNANVAKTLEVLDITIDVLKSLMIEKLGVTEAEMKERYMGIEDELAGLILSSEAAKLGDTVRLDVLDLGDKDKGASLMRFDKIGLGPFHLNKDIEAALVGMNVGETKEVTTLLKQKDGSEKEYKFEITPRRISTRKPSDEAKTEAGTEMAPAVSGSSDGSSSSS